MPSLPIRKIIHIDMDAFFASVEQRDNPAYRGKPIAVGGSSYRGVVAAASYEARVFGVRSAMSSVQAARRCPELIFVKSRFDEYRKVSQQIREIFFQYTDLVEPLSLDEAYLDVTENKKDLKSAIRVAQLIKAQILTETQLTASAGVSYNKFLAKIASDYDKPNGLKVILPQEALAFLETLPIEKFHGIGRVTAQKMHALQITTGKDLKKRSLSELVRYFGKAGRHYYQIVRGEDHREVKPHRIRKSVGIETTFSRDISDQATLLQELAVLSTSLEERVRRNQARGRTITLKVKFTDFQVITRSYTASQLLATSADWYPLATRLLDDSEVNQRAVQLLGLSLSNLIAHSSNQLHFDFFLD
ncbi:DNA polymerase IV [Tunicatimonas pelagia]|uniref:DNA polymerase IV n=1 Tax=Tunicatimonas pelagia TaxID=931531 RepID=UPI00266533CD|nr:DNA polymerase IV [Tunicatimonas pelagia]WKN40543.1 DNA polymerase IV [Tunicatimonas pelagia]